MAINRTDGTGIGRSTNQASIARSSLSDASTARVMAARAAVARGAVPPMPRSNAVDATPLRALPTNNTLAMHCTAAAPPAPSTRELAAMAQAVYTPGAAPPAGWAVATTAELAAIGIKPDMLSSPSSEFRAEVYVTTVCGQKSYTVAFRGTQSASDWGANLRQGIGLQSDHYNRALKIGEMLTVPEGARITITGHSLGGGLASAAALAAEVDATTFNSAGLSDATLSAAERIAAADGQVDLPDISAFYVRGEVLSALQDGGARFISPLLDLPEAVGTRIALDPQRPEGMAWWKDNPVARHLMNYVISSLPE